MELPLGYNTKISEKGSSLSGGQRQRIALVRSLLKKPKIIILDEATSALDIETEQKFVKNLLNKFKNSTIIMITHRLSNVINADKTFNNHSESLKQVAFANKIILSKIF